MLTSASQYAILGIGARLLQHGLLNSLWNDHNTIGIGNHQITKLENNPANFDGHVQVNGSLAVKAVKGALRANTQKFISAIFSTSRTVPSTITPAQPPLRGRRRQFAPNT